jgi:hypothetical protein
MPWGIDPFEHAYRADETDSVVIAAVLVQRNMGAVDTDLFRRLHFAPDLVPVVFACDWLFHEIRINWNFPTSKGDGFLGY